MIMSRPSRARGLKLSQGANNGTYTYVAPLAGAWIETLQTEGHCESEMSRPSRARGLKHGPREAILEEQDVAPLAGAWIETP